MDLDLGELTGLIVIAASTGVVALSYLGAYMFGKARGRIEAERERIAAREEARLASADRLLVVEGAVDSMARAIERLADAQRIAALDPARQAADSPLGLTRRLKHDTPA